MTERLLRQAKIEPGSALSVALITGDFDLSGIGTVTHVEGKRVYGFGHPFMGLGACEYPLMTGYVHAIYPRQILMYLRDPTAALRQAAARLRPNGIVAMQEADLASDWAAPQTPLWAQVRGWFLQTLERAGVEDRMGLQLYRCFVTADLPVPEMTLESFVAGGPDAPAWGWANLIRGVIPLMERLGVVTSADVQPDTLADRLLAELTAANGIVIGPPMIGAWSRVRSGDLCH